MTVPATSPDAEILLIHSHTLDPRPFVGRLLESPVPSTGVIPWTIDNKYYTADVHFRLLQLIGDDDVEDLKAAVVVYAFEGNPPDPLPEALTEILKTCEPDIALAVRVQSSSSKASGSRDQFEHVFIDLGMDLEDELSEQEEEYDLPALESIRQTLQTHMWSNMVRKPTVQASDRQDAEPSSAPAFPVTFNESEPTTDFPSVNDLQLQVETIEQERHAELEEWLDEDVEAIAPEDLSFGDDFADFQSASTAAAAAAAPKAAPLDPTALLMHLNSVRAQLAGVQDEDERRLRAGREVQRVLANLGIDLDSEGEWEDDDDEDDDEDEEEEDGEEEEENK